MPHRLSIASLNTRGAGLSNLTSRYQAIADFFESSDVDLINFQEVHSYYHLRQLTTRLRSFPYAAYRASLAGPAGGLLTMSKHQVAPSNYHRLPNSFAKGILLTRLPELWIINTHLTANRAGDWSTTSRYYELHRAQLAALASTLSAIAAPFILTGDFNIPRDSALFEEFISTSQLGDAFNYDCPPTFRPEYLKPDQTPHCIDFLLSSRDLNADHAHLILTEKHPTAGFPSDHLGIAATFS